jgi:type IV pilus assembly protein PilM
MRVTAFITLVQGVRNLKISHLLSSSLVGIDVQPRAIRLVHVRKRRREFILESAVSRELAAGIVADGRIREWELFAEILTSLVHDHDLSGMTASISLPVSLVRMQCLSVPAGISDTLIEAEIKYQIERDFPGMTESLCIDFSVSGQRENESLDVFFIAARKEYLEQYVNCINSAGLRVKIVDIDVCALTRLFSYCPEMMMMQGEVCAIVVVSDDIVSLIIYSERGILHHQDWEAGIGADLLTQVKTRMQIFFASRRDIVVHKLAIYCKNAVQQAPVSHFHGVMSSRICHPDLSSIIKFGTRVQFDSGSEIFSGFLVACGVAMREAPVW